MARLSLEHGFDVVPGRFNAGDLGLDAPGVDETLPSEALRYEDRTGQDSDLTAARDLLEDAVRDAESWNDLASKAGEKGYRFEASGRGMVFRDGAGGFVKASAISRDAARQALETRFGETLTAHLARGAVAETPAADPPPADRRPAEKPDLAATARRSLSEATSWADLEERLSKDGLTIRPRGRGLVVGDESSRVKASDVDRAYSKSQLEKRFKQTYRDHAAGAAPPGRTVTRDQAHEIDRKVRALQTFEKDTKRVIGRLAVRDRALRSTEPTTERFRQIAADKKAIAKMFQDAFKNPVKAQARFEAMRKRHGYGRVLKTLREKPAKIGALKGASFVVSGSERRSAERAVQAGVARIEAYLDKVADLRKNERRIAADRRVQEHWKSDTIIGQLCQSVGATAKQHTARRIELERAVMKATEGLSDDQLKGLPLGKRLRQAAIADTVSRLRSEATDRRQGGRSEPMPSLTATPKEQKAFDAARDYARAREAYDRALFRNAESGRAIAAETVTRLETAANRLSAEQPEGVKYLSRFGRSRAELATDATKQPPITTKQQDRARRLDRLQETFKQTGRGVGAVLSLLRRR